MTSSLKKIVLGGLITGLGTGLGWSVFVYVYSYDQVFNGREFALSLILLGIGAGGANILQMTIAGAFGGVFWASPFVLYTLVKRYLYR